MKPILFSFLIAFLFCSQSTTAQFSISGEVGANLSTVSFSDDQGLDIGTMTAISFGALPIIRINERWQVAIPVMLYNQGYEEKTTITSYRNTYLEIIPQLEYQPVESVGIFLGSGIGLLVREARKVNNGSYTKINNIAQDSEIGVVVGSRFYLGSFHLAATFDLGIAPAYEYQFTGINGQSSDITARYRSVMISAGYRLFGSNR